MKVIDELDNQNHGMNTINIDVKNFLARGGERAIERNQGYNATEEDGSLTRSSISADLFRLLLVLHPQGDFDPTK